MTADTTTELFKNCNNIIAIKEASGDINQVSDVARRSAIQVFAGDDSMLIPTIAVGGVGIISVASNLYPSLVDSTFCLSMNSYYPDARMTYAKYAELVKLLFVATNPVPLKLFLNEVGTIATSEVRLPLVKPHEWHSLLERFREWAATEVNV